MRNEERGKKTDGGASTEEGRTLDATKKKQNSEREIESRKGKDSVYLFR